jgi:hypothetical protein
MAPGAAEMAQMIIRSDEKPPPIATRDGPRELSQASAGRKLTVLAWP